MALKFLSVPMLTTLKNLSNLFTIIGDHAFYGRTYNWGVWMTLLLMGISAGVGALMCLRVPCMFFGLLLLLLLLIPAFNHHHHCQSPHIPPPKVQKPTSNSISGATSGSSSTAPALLATRSTCGA